MGRPKRAVRTLTIEAMLREGQSAVSIARVMGISKQWVHQIKKRMLEDDQSTHARGESHEPQNPEDRNQQRSKH